MFKQSTYKNETFIKFKKDLNLFFFHFFLRELCSRSLDGLPFFEDLGLLSLNYLIKTSSNSIFSGQDAKDKSNVERAKLLILSLGHTLDSSFDKSK